MMKYKRDFSKENENDKNKYIGKIFNSINYGDFIIIGVADIQTPNKDKKYICEFIETKFQTLATLNNIKQGRVADWYKKTIFNVGFLGDKMRKGNEKAYEEWHDMLKRCYDIKKLINRPTYNLVEVDEKWHCFSNYLIDREYILGYDNVIKYPQYKFCLDKDIITNSKIYSFQTTCFVPMKINNFFTNEKSHNTTGYVGVSFHKTSQIYRVNMSTDHTQKSISGFLSPVKACEKYFEMKQEYLNNLLQTEYCWLNEKIKIGLINKLNNQKLYYLNRTPVSQK